MIFAQLKSTSNVVTVDGSSLWHNIWLDCGHLREGLVADIMSCTRAAYHYAVRNIRNNSSDIIKQRFASAIVENRNRDFWRESRKVNGRARDTQRTVDSLTQNEYIADVFAKKYEDLYTSVRYDDVEMDVLRLEIEEKVEESGYDSNCLITFNDITNAISKLKPGKRDGNLGLSSDHVSNACDELYIHIALLLSPLVVHGYTIHN